MAEDALIVFTPSGRRGRFPQGTTVLQAARRLGVDIDSVCGGRGLCGRCQVEVSEGAFAKHGITSRADHITPWNEVEQRYKDKSKKGMAEGRRLSCQCELVDDIVIDVPADSQVHKQVVRKRAEVRDIVLEPTVRLYYITVEEPDMHNPSGDLERVIKALHDQWGLDTVQGADIATLRELQKILRQGAWAITVALHDDTRIMAAWPGFSDQVYGVAIDIGSTTVAAHVCKLDTGEVVAANGIMNPQIRFGEDLMSRVSYSMMNPGGDKDMSRVVHEAINEVLTESAREAGIEPTEILELTFVGNPIMHHLLLGIDPVELGGAPFALATNHGITLRADELDITAIHPNARAFVLPCIAGHVGADTAGVVLSETPHLSDDIVLVVDVGTNAEIVLGNKDRLLAASSPTGPAFEGAQISSGQRAASGAIERVRIDPETLEPRFKVIGADPWSTEEGFRRATRKIGVTGICGSGIIEALGEMYLAGIIATDGTIDGNLAAKSDRIVQDGRTWSYILHDGEPEVRITQNDVRAIQLAKAALYAGARLLMDQLGIDKPDRIVLAGAFGSHIDTTYAMILGLLPDCELDKVASAGNAAGTGARIALLNKTARREIEDIVRRIEKIETAVEPKFQAHFVDAMGIPHTTANYDRLARSVTLPAPKTVETGDAGGGSRRRRRGRSTAGSGAG
jgi:uncharacterized 2Fe-2S/4Fe-4S cluster protein (DUF4445 family)